MFKNLFGNKDGSEKKQENQITWIPLTSLEQLEKIENNSASRTQMIFKHSTTCGISRMVFNRFGSGFDFEKNRIDPYYLDLHAFRDVSNAIAGKFQIMHQSPQLVIIKNGVVVAHDSHGGITGLNLAEFV